VVKALLAAHGFEASMSSGGSDNVFPLGIDGTGGIRLTVRAEDADDATRVIASVSDDRLRAGGLSLADEYEALEGLLHYRFRDRGLLEHALTHRSRANEDITGGVTDNESMEFLGDAVLGFVMADMLFRTYPDRDEGQKSKMKSGLVSALTLGRQAVRLGLGQHLLLGRGEEKSGGRRKPTLLADTYEAIIAALYLDGGVDAARGFIEREFGTMVDEAGVSALPGDDYKSALQELLQANGQPLPDYVVAEESGPAHRRVFRIDVAVAGDVLASGDGRTKKEAEQDAARQALARLGA
jgi:ribonuclease-3